MTEAIIIGLITVVLYVLIDIKKSNKNTNLRIDVIIEAFGHQIDANTHTRKFLEQVDKEITKLKENH